jgi:branched-chain amino acid transport system permease protein
MSPAPAPAARRRATIGLALLLALLIAAPYGVNDYVLSVLILVLYQAYVGQAWNVMMGFAGQLSLGHSLYVGLGAYASAALFVKFGIGPALGLWAAVAVSVAAGMAIGFLAFRFHIGGTYFALLTIACAEFTRIGFDHLNWVGGSGGYFLPVAQRTQSDLLNLRGTPAMFYYVLLAMTAGAFLLCERLLRSRVGYYWLALREDPDAAQALGIHAFRYRMLAMALSSGLTALGGVFFAFYYNNLFPEQIFNMGRSIELSLGPIVGGLGSLFGPILGAFVLTVLAELLRAGMDALKLEIPGATQFFYGFCLLFVVMFLPQGIWPRLKERLGLGAGPPEER